MLAIFLLIGRHALAWETSVFEEEVDLERILVLDPGLIRQWLVQQYLDEIHSIERLPLDPGLMMRRLVQRYLEIHSMRVSRVFPEQWKSAYKYRAATPAKQTWGEFHKNEHAELAYLALMELLGNKYPYQETYTVTDLNVSLFRPALRWLGTVVDNPTSGSLLERRTLPPPHQFAGLPDFSYTMYDWINKNALCPAIPEDAEERSLCHEFKGWMGALNSTHFGNQARLMYQHLHELAVNLAGEAETLRETIVNSGKPEELVAHRNYLREAELMALAFEGYAQHFLQDRWSTGHMWERWNSGSYDKLVSKDLITNLVVGGASGLLHGSESILGLPDPVCSPGFTSDKAQPGTQWKKGLPWTAAPALWRHCPKNQCLGFSHPRRELWPGVGDHRLVDMLDGEFGREYAGGIHPMAYTDFPINVETQRRQLMNCSMAGWAEVIRAFGEHDGGYGIHDVGLNGSVSGFNSLKGKHGCWDMWLTNGSIELGWRELSLAHAGRLVVWPGAAKQSKDQRPPWVQVTWRIRRHALFNRDGVTLARGGIGKFGAVEHGGEYELPEYVEPVELQTLPVRQLRNMQGRDKHTIYAFFNRATTKWWCGDRKDKSSFGIAERLERLRGTDDQTKTAACAYLADRVYKGTDPTYEGQNKEVRTVNGRKGNTEVDPICAYYGVVGKAYDERVPRYLHPGYIREPYARANGVNATESTLNWCQQVPVLDYEDQPDLRNREIVARVTNKNSAIRVSGHNLGLNPGRIWLLNPETRQYESNVRIDRWGHRRIDFRFPEGREIPDGDYALLVKRHDGTDSVGRFILRVEYGRETEETATRADKQPDDLERHCDAYVKERVKQYQQAECNRQTGGWHENKTAHKKWCLSVPIEVSKQELQRKANELRNADTSESIQQCRQ